MGRQCLPHCYAGKGNWQDYSDRNHWTAACVGASGGRDDDADRKKQNTMEEIIEMINTKLNKADQFTQEKAMKNNAQKKTHHTNKKQRK